MKMAPYRYTACGLEIQSEFAISHLPVGEKSKPADVRISAMETPSNFEADISTPQWRANSEKVELFGLSEETCICTAGTHITFSGTPPTLDETSTLLGRALAVISMQRGNPVLHAAVVEKGGKSFAVSGRSGAGKSTLLAELILRDFRVVADDIAVFNVVGNDFIVQPLYPTTRRRAKFEPPQGWRAIPGVAKHVSINVPFCPVACAIERLFVLAVSSSPNMPIRIYDISKHRRHEALGPQLYRAGIARAVLGYNGLKQKTKSAAQVLPISSVTRPPDCNPAALADAIIAHLAIM